jgi:hypothetical protein
VLLPLGHQVDVELVDADRLELAELLDRLVGRAQHAEAVADLVAHERAVLGARARVLVVVVARLVRDVVGQRARHDRAVGAVAPDQVLDVVGDHRREPAHLVARVREVVADVARRADDALQRSRVAARLLGRLARSAHRPLDDVRVGELDDHAVAEAARDRQHLRAVAGHVHLDLRQVAAHPWEVELGVVPLNGLAVHERLDHPQRLLEALHRHGLLPDDAARGVAAADAHDHAPLGDVVERRVGAGDDRRLARAGVGDHVAELQLLGRLRGERHGGERVLPQHVRVVCPAVLEPLPLGQQ